MLSGGKGSQPAGSTFLGGQLHCSFEIIIQLGSQVVDGRKRGCSVLSVNFLLEA